MSIQHDDSKFDVRTLSRSLREGKLTKKELDQYLKGLPDESKKGVEFAVWEEATNPASKSRKSSPKSPKSPTFEAASEN